MPILALRKPTFPVAYAGATALCLLGLAIGVPLDAAPATMIACGGILALGLPHGTLDLDLFARDRPGVAPRVILLLYLGFAGVMAAAWLISPLVAFAFFYLLAVAHFAEDWVQTGSAFLALGLALALLALPALTYRAELGGLFAALTGSDASLIAVELLRLVAPVAAIVAAVAVAMLWSLGARAEAWGGGLALIAMAMLPPVVGFALFFCLFHSPRHLRAGLIALSARAIERRRPTIMLLTLAAAGIAAIAYRFGAALPTPDRLMSASFMTLSILTLPHMAVPMVLRAAARRLEPRPGASAPSRSLGHAMARAAPESC